MLGTVCQPRLLSDFEFLGEQNGLQPCRSTVPDTTVRQNELVVRILGSKSANLFPIFIVRFEAIGSEGRAVHALGFQRNKDAADIAVDRETDLCADLSPRP